MLQDKFISGFYLEDINCEGSKKKRNNVSFFFFLFYKLITLVNFNFFLKIQHKHIPLRLMNIR